MKSEEFIKYKLGDIARIKGGKRLPKGKQLLKLRNGHPYIRVTDMGSRFIPNDKIMYVPNDIFPSIRNYITNTDDVLLSIVGTIGQVALVDEKLNNASLTENCVKIQPIDDRLNPFYLYYFLSSSKGQQEIAKGIVGSTQPKLPLYNIEKIEIPLFSIEEQKSIIELLSSFDNKIELNLQMNKTLEAIAQAIFKEWFVDFRFPGFDGTLADGLPNGWKIGKVGDIANVIDCLHSKKPERVSLNTGYLLLQLNNILDNGLLDLTDKFYISRQDYLKWISRVEISEGNCIITNVGRVGSVARIPSNVKAALGRNMTGIRLKKDFPFPAFLIQLLVSDYMRVEIERRKDFGTILDALNVKNIPLLCFPLADKSVIFKFEQIVSPLRDKMESNLKENYILTQLRDTLLPKLMTGKIKVA